MANTLFVGKVYLRFDELSSTNDYARELLSKSKPPEGMVIRADIQSAGRGQYGSSWVSEPGKNLTLSVLFYPSWIDVRTQFQLSAAVALAVWDTVRAALKPLPGATPAAVKIKWPNDIYIGPRKAAGILIQSTLGGQFLQNSVVGIGLNVNQTVFPETAPNATSLATAAGRQFSLDEISDTLLECLERRYFQLKAGRVQALWGEYHHALLGMREERTFIRAGGEVFSGVILGVREDGCLVIRSGAREDAFNIKEVRMA